MVEKCIDYKYIGMGIGQMMDRLKKDRGYMYTYMFIIYDKLWKRGGG